MSDKTKKRNETFWPDDLVDGAGGGLGGWTPIARVLLANWYRFDLGSEYFATIVWLLSWVRKDFKSVKFTQVAIANQQRVHRSTIYRQMRRLAELGIIKFISDDTISLAPFMEKLASFEAERRREAALKSIDESLKAVGLHENTGGRPPKPDQPSTAAFGEPAYPDICEEDSAWQYAGGQPTEPEVR